MVPPEPSVNHLLTVSESAQPSPSPEAKEQSADPRERRDLWEDVKRVLCADGTLKKAQRETWLDCCALFVSPADPYAYVLRTQTSAQREMVWRFADDIRFELRAITRTACTLAVECAAPQKQRSTIA